MRYPKGNIFGTHRVLEPRGVLPQPALVVDNDMSVLYDNEILVDVEILNVDSASFTQLEHAAEGDADRIAALILAIVAERGKLQNPVTGSGGMFIGTVAKIGPALQDKIALRPGDRVASLVSLSLTPLNLERITEVRVDNDQVHVQGQAILFESGIYAKLPSDLPGPLALAVLDVAGAPAQVARLVKPGDTVVIVGAGGKSGVLCAYEAHKRAGVTGTVIGIDSTERGLAKLRSLDLCDHTAALSATDAVACHEAVAELTGGRLADLVVNCVNVPNTEMASILMCRQGGTVYFFGMATSFTKAALGAEGVGRDITMLIGNGYAKDHAEIALNLLRESPPIRALYEETYC
ncbi:MAG: L-erythro-3,5-diaminohexanoate dehydrogenase [Deltaproteobacteria bacterium HGW-Deltaproteobacteria-14]|jgi:L-erythro-3,5-diaminohexanoate dehydrogenase|nr:MAG: L-erythro-3,5-diaminohexanoate dehydrogenase [Deltaproteobacteria bacterium HGW-Deltaproteobacteria-14]